MTGEEQIRFSVAALVEHAREVENRELFSEAAKTLSYLDDQLRGSRAYPSQQVGSTFSSDLSSPLCLGH